MYLGKANKQQTMTIVLLRVLGLLKHSTNTKTAQQNANVTKLNKDIQGTNTGQQASDTKVLIVSLITYKYLTYITYKYEVQLV